MPVRYNDCLLDFLISRTADLAIMVTSSKLDHNSRVTLLRFDRGSGQCGKPVDRVRCGSEARLFLDDEGRGLAIAEGNKYIYLAVTPARRFQLFRKTVKTEVRWVYLEGPFLVTVEIPSMVRCFSRDSPDSLVGEFQVQQAVTALHVMSSEVILVGSNDGSIFLYRAKTIRPLRKYKEIHGSKVTSIKGPGQRFVITASD